MVLWGEPLTSSAAGEPAGRTRVRESVRRSLARGGAGIGPGGQLRLLGVDAVEARPEGQLCSSVACDLDPCVWIADARPRETAVALEGEVSEGGPETPASPLDQALCQ